MCPINLNSQAQTFIMKCFCLWRLQTALWHLRLSSQKEKEQKSISVPGLIYVLIYHCYCSAKDLFPQLMKAEKELLHLRFLWQVQISLIDIKAVMIALLRTRRRATPGRHDPAAIAWQGPWIYGGQARLCPNCCIAIFFSYPLEHTSIRWWITLEKVIWFSWTPPIKPVHAWGKIQKIPFGDPLLPGKYISPTMVNRQHWTLLLHIKLL